MKQRAPMRAPSPTYACAAISADGIDAWRPPRRSPPDGRRDAAADPGAAASRRVRTWRADWRRPAPAPASRAADFASRMTAPARVSGELRDVLGIGEEGDRPRARPATARRRNPPSPRDRRAARSRIAPPVRRASLSWRPARCVPGGARLRASRVASRAPERVAPRPASAHAPAATASTAAVMSTVGVA